MEYFNDLLTPLTILEKKEKWLNNPQVSLKDKEIILNSNENSLKDYFQDDLIFKNEEIETPYKLGSSYLNEFTIKRLTIGIAIYLIKNYGLKESLKRGVVVNCTNDIDSKIKYYLTDVLLTMGIKVYSFKELEENEIPFAIKDLNSLFSISLYQENDNYIYQICDIESSLSEETLVSLNKILKYLPNEMEITYGKNKDKGKLIIGNDKEIKNKYLKKELSLSLYKDVFKGKRKVKIALFSFDCCFNNIETIIKKLGYEVISIPITNDYDINSFNENDFIDYNLLKENYNLFFLKDKNTDHLEIYYLNSQGKITHSTNEEISALLLQFILSTYTRRLLLKGNEVILTTLSSSPLVSDISSLYLIKTICTDSFNNIPHSIELLKQNNLTFLFGYDEFGNYLMRDSIKENDLLQEIVLFSETDEYLLREGRTIDSFFKDLLRQTGKYINYKKTYIILEKDFNNIIFSFLTLENSSNRKIGDFEIIAIFDYVNFTYYDFKTNLQEKMNNPYMNSEETIKIIFDKKSYLLLNKKDDHLHLNFYLYNYDESDVYLKLSYCLKAIENLLHLN